jgi:preprotein translocase subunit SecF
MMDLSSAADALVLSLMIGVVLGLISTVGIFLITQLLEWTNKNRTNRRKWKR